MPPKRRNQKGSAKPAKSGGGHRKKTKAQAQRPVATMPKDIPEESPIKSREEYIIELLQEEEAERAGKKGKRPQRERKKNQAAKRDDGKKEGAKPPRQPVKGKPRNSPRHPPPQEYSDESENDEELPAREGSYYQQHGQAIDANVEEPDDDASNEDYSDTQNERAREYRKGGYHPVVLGDLYNDRYRVVYKLGWGYFSTVWLVWDYGDKKFCAMKIQKSAEHYRDAAFDEIKLLSQIMHADPEGNRCCARMTDSFEHTGPFGKHVAMIFDVLGENLLKLIERYEYRGIPIPIVKSIAKQMLIGLEHIHSINIIHTDIKPENILLSSPKHRLHHIMKIYRPPPLHDRVALMERKVALMTKSQRKRYHQKLRKMKAQGKAVEPALAANDPDIEGSDAEVPTPGHRAPTAAAAAVAELVATQEVAQEAVGDPETMSETDPEWEVERFHNVSLADFGNSCWTDRQFTDEVQTRQYRSPEVILGDGYGPDIDIWSCACTIFELLTGEFLFDPKEGPNYSRDEDHLALMMELLGEFPSSMSMGDGKFRQQYFDDNGELRHIRELKFWGLRDVLHQKYHFTVKKSNEIALFLLPMLAVDPKERATASEMISAFEPFFEIAEDDFSPHCYEPADGEADEEDRELDDMEDIEGEDEASSRYSGEEEDEEESSDEETTPRRSRRRNEQEEEEEPEADSDEDRGEQRHGRNSVPEETSERRARSPLRTEKENEILPKGVPKPAAREGIPWGRRRPPTEPKPAIPAEAPPEEGDVAS